MSIYDKKIPFDLFVEGVLIGQYVTYRKLDYGETILYKGRAFVVVNYDFEDDQWDKDIKLYKANVRPTVNDEVLADD